MREEIEELEELEELVTSDDLQDLELCRKKVWKIHMMLVHMINAELEEKNKNASD